MTQHSPPGDAASAELPESGWGALLAWIAGPGWAYPRRGRGSGHLTIVTTDDARGTTSRSEARTDADQRVIDESIDEYLSEAGVSPGPSGVAWALRLPAGKTDEDLWHRVNTYAVDRSPTAPTAADERDRLTEALREWFP